MRFFHVKSLLMLTLLCSSASMGLADTPCTLKTPDSSLTKYGEQRVYYRHWLGACRPGGYCSANIYVASPSNPIAYHLRVGREMFGLDYHLIFTPAEVMAAPDSAITMVLDREPPMRLEAGADDGWAIEGQSINEYYVGQSRANLSILPAMKDGAQLSVGWQGEDGSQHEVDFSLMGLTDTLCWMDHQQSNQNNTPSQ